MIAPAPPASSAATIEIDQLIDARWVIPIEPAGKVLENYSLAIQGEQILELLPTAVATNRYRGKRHIKLDQHVLMPGLVNLHTHAAMSLLRGYADDMPLMRWLQERIWPAESRLISTEFVYDGSLLACWEMLRGGITCFNDMYFFPAATASAALTVGMRAALGITVFEFPSAYGSDAEDYLNKGLRTREAFVGESLISFCLAPHAPYTVADRSFARVAEIAAQINAPIHIHLHETIEEIESSKSEYGIRPLERLRRLGLLDSKLIAVHAVHLTNDEILTLAEHGCHVAHCPTSNMKLASGIAPVKGFLEQGVGVGLGSDGAASNNRIDLFQEMRHAALLAKVANRDAACLNAHHALSMATIEGARALGLENKIGSIMPGKAADLLALRLDDWMLQPCFDPASHLVYVAGREQVSHVWVAGKLQIDDSIPVGLNITALLDTVKLWQNKLSNQG